jgi:AcrR family transcriptional regulator
MAMRRGTASHGEQRARLLEAARAALHTGGPEALQARRLTAEIGMSTQAVYTLFGGMPGLFDALITDALSQFTAHIAAVADTDDPVADHFARGWAYLDWALAHPQLYRLMFGLTGADLRIRARLGTTVETMADFPEGRAAIEVLVRSVRRIIDARRIRPSDPHLVARQFLSATHGHVLLQIAGALGSHDESLLVIGALATNLMIGLGDSADAVERSLLATLATRSHVPFEDDVSPTAAGSQPSSPAGSASDQVAHDLVHRLSGRAR